MVNDVTQVSAVRPEASAVRRKHAILGLKLLAGLLMIAAPILAASLFVPGLFGVAFFGVLAATFGWISGGPRTGMAVVASLSVVGSLAVLTREHTWVLALILIMLGLLYGYAASRGIGKAVLQLPILTPYFMMAPPALFTDPPRFDLDYFIGLIVVMNVTGLWAIVVLHCALGKRSLEADEPPDRIGALLYGGLLGLFSAGVMVIGMNIGLKSHWAWVTLTLYVLADPTQLITPKRMFGRMLGTFGGFGVVAVLTLIGVPDPVLEVLAYPALWLCLFFLILKRPYWQYSLFLTISVVLMNSKGVSTLLLDTERFVFTLIGAGLATLAALVVNLVMRRSLDFAPQGDAPERYSMAEGP